MKELRIYVDTSVIGGCFDEEFEYESNLLVQMAVNGKVMLPVSDVTCGRNSICISKRTG